MKTYTLEITMDATDEWDFIEAILLMKDREFLDHIKEVKT